MNDSVSIVIEWENVLLSGESRAGKMLELVIAQANRLPNCLEIVISANDDQPELTRRPAELRADIAWRRLVNTGCHYYDLKNLGAQEAKGDVIVFVDSDVIPEPDWLQELLMPFSHPATNVSCGRAYIEPTDLYNKAFALFWFFPLRPELGRGQVSDEWMLTNHFFANNIAFRRATALSHPFPRKTTISRGSCLELADALRQDHIPIVLNRRALVAHPPPVAGSHFTQRALAQGRDRLLRSRGISRTIIGSCWRWLLNSTRTVMKITYLHNRVDLPWRQIPMALAIGLAYYSLYMLGEVGAILRLRKILSITI